jgi:hypothetical protein
MSGPNEDQEKADRDNHSNQLNPNNDAYYDSRSGDDDDDDHDKLCDSDD